MTVTIAQAPPAGLQLVRENIWPELAGGTNILEAAIEKVESLKVHTLEPHPIYTVPLGGILAKRFLADASLTAWQYILLEGDQTFALAEVAANRKGQPSDMAYSTRYSRKYAQDTLAAIGAARAQFERSRQPYELRIVRVPDAYFRAVWMHAPQDDALFPIAPVPVAGLTANARTSEASVIAALQSLAQQRMNTSDQG